MPHRRNKTIQELNKSLTTITRNSKQKQRILCWDFNCLDISWDIGNVNTCRPDRSTQQTLSYVTESAQLTQVHNSSTRESKLLDLVFTKNPTIVTHSVSVPGISDHDIIDTDFDVKIQYQNKHRRQIYQFARLMMTLTSCQIKSKPNTTHVHAPNNCGQPSRIR